ncbi:MAG: GntR family transcriptional regulator [Rhodobacterales bacterium]|jgi:DNA-binding GntR family transcriptional regulator
MASFTENIPAHETVYRALRDKILFGDLSPGQAVTIQGLVEEMQVSMTPVREAIRRLSAEGALEFKGNRRVTVPVMGLRRFTELAFARTAIEPELAETAAQNIDAAGIETLNKIDQQIDAAIKSGDIHGYMRGNYLFHFTLYGHANSRVLLPIAQSLWLRYGPMSRIICGRYGTSNLEDRHEEALQMLRDENPKGVADAIRKDITQGFEIVHEGLFDP